MGKIVPFEGSTSSKIYVVGEAPGENEEVEGRPFVGGSGRLLNRLLMEVGLVRSECRIGNLMRVRPPGNNFAHFYLDKMKKFPRPELLEGIRYLKEDIKMCNPNIVLVLGGEALRALTGEMGITNWRGSVLFSKELGCKLLPTLHPASLLRAWGNVPLVLFDFKKLRREAKTPDYTLRTKEFILAPDYDRVMYELGRLKDVKRISFDVETDEDRHITALALADGPYRAISIPFTNSTGAPYWKLEEEIAVWKECKMVLENPNIGKIAQNAQFDIIMLMINPYHINVKGLVLDTMCAHHTIYPEMAASEGMETGAGKKMKTIGGGGKSLGLLCSIYTTQPYYKHWGKSGNDMTFWKYNGMDACVTFEAAIELEKEMKEFGVFEFYHKFVHPLIPILLEMQIRGVKIDQSVRVDAYKWYEEETEKLQAKIDGAVGRPINVMSHNQLKQLLYVDLGLPPKYKRGTIKTTTDEEALRELGKKYKSPIFDLILEIRHNRKLLGTYLDDKGGEDGRLRCSYVIGGTETGRLSSRQSVFGSGTNLQNIPHGVCRRMFVADGGKVFMEADLSQAEARVVAYLSEEGRLIDLFSSGGDIHTQNAAWIFNKELSEVSLTERTLAKRLVHASNYGIGPRAFGHHAGIREAEARVLLGKYFDTFPNIKAWQLRTQAGLNKTRTVTTPMGRKRTFFGRWGEQLFREAYAFVPQSTVADLLNLALIRLREARPEVELVLQVHDSFVLQCLIEDVGKWYEWVEEAFDIPILVGGKELRIPIEIKVGKNWEDMEVVK